MTGRYGNVKEPHYGMIIYKNINKVPHFLLVKRRRTYGLKQIILGNYQPYAFAELSLYEKTELIRICRMDVGWQDSFEGFYMTIGEALHTDRYFYHLDTFIKNRAQIRDRLENSSVLYPYGIWEFPKGKKEKKETGIQCAFRETYEESDVMSDSLCLRDIQLPIESYNGWLCQYYVCNLTIDSCEDKVKETGETSDIVWCSYEDALRLIPEAMVERRMLLKHVYTIVNGEMKE